MVLYVMRMKKILTFIIVCFCMIGMQGCTTETEKSPDMEEGEQQVKLEAEYGKYGFNFSEKDVETAIQIAQQYYADEIAKPIDEQQFYADEIVAVEQRKKWYAQGIEINYDKVEMYKAVLASSLKLDIEKYGAGNAIQLQVVLLAEEAPEYERRRVIILDRENKDSEWFVRTEGIQ